MRSRSSRHLFLVATLGALPWAASAQSLAGSAAPSRDPSSIPDRLRTAVRVVGQPDPSLRLVDRMRFYHVPAVSIAVVDDFRIVYAGAFGTREFGTTEPVDTTTLFLAGSISKPVFSSGILKLVQEGKLALDEDVNARLTSWHLPETRFTANERVTLRHLLTHTAGLTVWGFPGYEMGKPIPIVPQVLDGAPPANTPAVRNDTMPGALWRYSGGGLTIAQLLATDVTHETLPALMQRLVLAPAGMTRSTYENPLPNGRWSEAATGHEHVDTPVPGHFHVYPEMAAAGLWTTPSELARWAIALSRAYDGDTTAPFSPLMARQLISCQVIVRPPYGNGCWGLGVQVAGAGDSVSFSHGGRDEGFVAQFEMWPAQRRGIFIMTNGVSGALINEIMRAFAETYGMDIGRRVDKQLASVSRAALASLAGRYLARRGTDSLVIEIQAAGDGLDMSLPAQAVFARLLPQGDDRFVDLTNGAMYRFTRVGSSPTARGATLELGMGPNRTIANRIE